MYLLCYVCVCSFLIYVFTYLLCVCVCVCLFVRFLIYRFILLALLCYFMIHLFS